MMNVEWENPRDFEDEGGDGGEVSSIVCNISTTLRFVSARVRKLEEG